MEKKETKKKVYVVTEMTGTVNGDQVDKPSKGYALPTTKRLPNPAIPFEEYRIVCDYCTKQPNMARTDWMELAIIEKLHNDHLISGEYFDRRKKEIISRPPIGYRKNTKNNN